MKHIYRNILFLIALMACASCDIKNDIPYPIVHGQITEFEVEGQCGEDGGENITTIIDKEKRQVNIYVNDTVNIKRLRVKKITLAGATYNPDVNYQDTPSLDIDPAKCSDYNRFPKNGFSKPDSRFDTRVDFSKPVKFVVSTYQDYEWTVKVTQIIIREIEVENQVGKAVIDPDLCNAVVYVNKSQKLSELKVNKFTLGGKSGSVSPDPSKATHYDFSDICRFTIRTGWDETQIWRVSVQHTEEEIKTTATAFARNHQAIISGDKPNNTEPLVEYRKKGESVWNKVDIANIKTTSTTYKATITNLEAGTEYEYKVASGKYEVEMQAFTTATLQQMPNSSFDDWHTDASNAKLYCPWAAGGTSFWDTGNRGATTVGNSNSFPTDDNSTGSGKAAYLESKYIVIKFAAGNIFTGTYLKTDGTNGILGFGRPFTAFPTKLTFDYKYTSKEIDKVGDKSMEYLKGRPDSCNIYIALWHIEDGDYEQFQGDKYPIIIKTKPGQDQNLFSVNDPRVIAYGNFTSGTTVTSWTPETIEVKYKNTEVAPTHILVVASSSKYGDFFTGGVGSTLVLDNLKLIYE
jgi:hypothetical protein